ncbi:MAG: hypothetical protein JXR60_05975 [Bacteroidales bacterium]|nr:hypothetical protein [Bacteroidales bacterium]
MDYQEVLDRIDSVIYENDNEEITAELSNPLLKDIVNYVNVVPTGILIVDPINGDDAKATFDKRFAFRTAEGAVKFAVSGNLIIFSSGDYDYKKGNWAKQGVYYHFMPGARIIIRDDGDRPFNFEWGGIISITGHLQIFGKEGYNGSVNALNFPINIYNQTTDRAIVHLELDEVTAHLGGVSIRGNIERSYFKARKIAGMVDNAGFQHIVTSGNHFFEVEHLDVSRGNIWAGTNGYYFSSPTKTDVCYIGGRIKLMTIENNTTLWNAGIRCDYNDTGSYHDSKRVDIKVDRTEITADVDNVCTAFYQNRWAGTINIEFGSITCKNRAVAVNLNDAYYWESKTKLVIHELISENRAIKLNLHTNTEFDIDIKNAYQKASASSNFIEINTYATDAGFLKLRGRIKNDNGDGINITKTIKSIDIDQMIIECSGDYSIICDTPSQELRLLNHISTNKPFKNIINTVANATIYDL